MINKENIKVIDISQMITESGEDDIFINVNIPLTEKYNKEGVIIRNGIIIVLCSAKQGIVTIDGKKYRVTNKNVIILPENHVINYISPLLLKEHSVIGVSVDYILNMPSPIDTSIFGYSRHLSVIKITDDKFEDLQNYFNFIHKEMNENSKYQKEIIQSIFYALILEILAEYEKIFDSDNNHDIKANDLSDRFFRLLTIHYKKHRSVQFYADKLNLTPKYLSTAIKKVTGRPILEWIHEAVLIDAKMLLRTTDLTVQQISDQLNFSSPSAFVQFFKKHTGKTPRKI